jgi:hypothetical protein
MNIKVEDYDVIVFLTRLVYYDLEYPDCFNCTHSLSLRSGLKLNKFDMDDYDLVVICGTNSFRDWVANFKVALRLTPIQYKQAYEFINSIEKDSNKPIIIVGHSLGGGIAEYVASSFAIYFNVTCITFNGCGSKHLINPSLRDNVNTYNIITSRDILNGITRRIPFAKNYLQHTGSSHIVKDDGLLPLSVKSHCNFSVFTKIDTDIFIDK